MKKLIPVFLFVSTCLFAQVETLSFGSRGQLTLYLPGDWKSVTTDMAGTVGSPGTELEFAL